MWCEQCQKDVPAIGSTDDSVRCAQCQVAFSEHESARSAEPQRGAAMPARKKAISTDEWLERALLEDWELEDELNEAQHLAKSLGVTSDTISTMRIDTAHTTKTTPQTSTARQPRTTQTSFFSWCMLSLGLMGFVFGAVLVGWSFFEDRPDLWRLGLPFTLGGQAALIIGLVFQLDVLSRSNRQAIASLDELDQQLDELRHTTSMLSTTHSSPSKSFYAHLADGASPNLLLADLKGQLDLLASRMSETR